MEPNTIHTYKQHLLEQKEMMSRTALQLKKEFMGLDDVIDRIIDAVTSWFFFPEMQEKPVIVNLWGLTGIGKTSLVRRLVELTGFAERYYRFDLGESTGRSFDIQDSFRDIYRNCDGEPFIIGLDEFQLARTINEDQEEIDRASTRAIWDLLDSGKFNVIDFDYNMDYFKRLIKQFDQTLERGVVVTNGSITANANIFKEITANYRAAEPAAVPEKMYFVSDDNLDTIFDIVSDTDMFLSKQDLRMKLCELDGSGTVDYLLRLYKKALEPKTVDCTKALVFIMGNLDEVYSMTRNFNPDMCADEFHRQSLEITVTQVKNALLNRFRSEQIARLGNIHIIYPAFNRKTFHDIIRIELDKIKQKVRGNHGLEMVFDTKIENLVYDEGVYPTQGTRPLFTTIYHIVNARLGKVLNEVYLKGNDADTLFFTVNETESSKDHAAIQVEYIREGITVHRLIDLYPLVLGKLRKEKQNDEQAIVAVHESGHAVLSVILMKTVPESVFSVTADNQSDGFVYARPKWNYVSKKDVINRLAMLLGGLAAERMIFGDENITMGSNSDLSTATRLATHVLYACGMGDTRAVYGNENKDETPTIIFDDHREGINREAEQMLVQAEELANKTLARQRSLLLHMADYLSDHRSISKEMIHELAGKYAVGFDMSEIVENADHLFYRGHLKKLVTSI